MEEIIPGIGLFGGSFDPVHKGHISIAQSFLESDYISELWILLTPHPPHKTDCELSDYKTRLRMLQEAFEPIKDVSISNIENQLPNPSYTVRTLRYFHKKYLQRPFFLCLGEDSVMDFDHWKNWEEILSYCKLLAAQRPSTDESPLKEEIMRQTHFVPHIPIDVSSTDIRQRVIDGKDISDLVPESVEKIIYDKKLYTQ